MSKKPTPKAKPIMAAAPAYKPSLHVEGPQAARLEVQKMTPMKAAPKAPSKPGKMPNAMRPTK
jgi:hypothetical protein